MPRGGENERLLFRGASMAFTGQVFRMFHDSFDVTDIVDGITRAHHARSGDVDEGGDIVVHSAITIP